MCGHFWHCDIVRGRGQALINYRNVHNYPASGPSVARLSDHRIIMRSRDITESPTRAAPVPSNVSSVKHSHLHTHFRYKTFEQEFYEFLCGFDLN